MKQLSEEIQDDSEQVGLKEMELNPQNTGGELDIEGFSRKYECNEDDCGKLFYD